MSDDEEQGKQVSSNLAMSVAMLKTFAGVYRV